MSDIPVLVRYHWHHAARFSPRGIHKAVAEVEGFNAKVAVAVTRTVGTMACAYSFCVLAFISLPAVLTQANFVPPATFPAFLIKASLIAFVAWIAQTFLQLVLLPMIIVGQNVQAAAADARAQKTFEDSELILGEVRRIAAKLGLDG